MRRCVHTVLLISAVVLGAGCATTRVQDARFRTLQPSTAFDRAVAAMEQHANGVHQANAQTGVIVSKWIDPDFGWGIPPRYLFYRYRATVVPNPADGSADVRLGVQAVYCGVLDSRDPDRMSSECGPPEHIPGSVVEQIARVQDDFKTDVFRRE